MHSASQKQFKVRALIIIIYANPLTLRAKFIPTKTYSLLKVYQHFKNISHCRSRVGIMLKNL